VLLFIPALYFVFISAFTKPESKGNESTVSNTVSTDTTKFINMIMNLDHRCGDGLWVKENVDRYKDSLGFNSVHVYPLDESLYGIFPNPLSSKQRSNIVDLINKVQNKNLKFFYEHAFFSYLCFAQRLVYEVPTVNGNTTANNGFCYKNVTVAPSSDSDRTVLHSVPGSNHDTVLLCSGIYENLQHSDKLSRQQDYSKWYLNPMVRANLTGIHDTTPIFKIKVINFKGEEDTSIIITAYDFKYKNTYNGNYIDQFYNYDIKNNYSIIGDTLTGLNKGKNRDALINCKIDFKIYTYGYVDFWFDKLTVDDFYANNLFDPDPNKNYENRITELLDAVSTETNVYSLYMDELTYSQLPCTKYVMDKIDVYNQSHGKDIKFMVSESNWMNFNHMRNHALEHKPMLTLLQPRALNLFSYEFFHGDENDVSSYVPSFAFNSVDFRIPNGWKTNNYNTYNNALQNNIFGHKNAASGGGIHPWGTFIYQVDLAKRNIAECSRNTLLYLNPQEYGEMWINEGESTFRGIIEPTNEEGGAQLMLSLAHGAQGLMWYIYQTKHYGP
ncbi:MAG: hypothetical protein WCK13_13245, partial [Ignavibacteriota bacterium]